MNQINIDVSLNKGDVQNKSIDFMSLNGISEQTMYNEHP